MLQPQRRRPWYYGAVLYHLYPLSFADANGDGFGDLRGIIDHLDYLNDGTPNSLGVTAVWLSPVYASPMKDWGYDVTDHRAIDPVFGTMADFDDLVAEAHRRDMKLLMDYVPNHTSSEHDWFKASRTSRNHPMRHWYTWADPAADGGPPNNWLSVFGGPAWTLDPTTGQYYLHTYLEEQPDLNWRHPEVRKALLDILRFWLDRGVDGFRVDSLPALAKDYRLRDDPRNAAFRPGCDEPTDYLKRIHSMGQASQLGPELKPICQLLDTKEPHLLLSEAAFDVNGLHELYGVCAEHPVHAPMNFNLINLPWSAAAYRDVINLYQDSLGEANLPNYVLGNHDQPRVASRVGWQQARLLAMLQLTLPGLPIVYNGEELGLTSSQVGPKLPLDPYGRAYPERNRDPERAPMPWIDREGGGFSRRTPWLPLPPDYRDLAVATQQRQPESFLSFYKRLIHLRRVSPALHDGSYRSILAEHPQVLAFQRVCGGDCVTIVLNFSDREQTVKLNDLGNMSCSTHGVDGFTTNHAKSVTLQPYEGQLYEQLGDRR